MVRTRDVRKKFACREGKPSATAISLPQTGGVLLGRVATGTTRNSFFTWHCRGGNPRDCSRRSLFVVRSCCRGQFWVEFGFDRTKNLFDFHLRLGIRARAVADPLHKQGLFVRCVPFSGATKSFCAQSQLRDSVYGHFSHFPRVQRPWVVMAMAPCPIALRPPP